MTGFGQSAYDDGRLQIGVEIKSLNSKFLDLNLRLPKIFADREIEIRNLISEKVTLIRLARALLSVRSESHQRMVMNKEDIHEE